MIPRVSEFGRGVDFEIWTKELQEDDNCRYQSTVSSGRNEKEKVQTWYEIFVFLKSQSERKEKDYNREVEKY